jgi:hypothetical protein
MLVLVSGRIDLVAETDRRGLETTTVADDEVTQARCPAMAAYPHFFAISSAATDCPRKSRCPGRVRSS